MFRSGAPVDEVLEDVRFRKELAGRCVRRPFFINEFFETVLRCSILGHGSFSDGSFPIRRVPEEAKKILLVHARPIRKFISRLVVLHLGERHVLPTGRYMSLKFVRRRALFVNTTCAKIARVSDHESRKVGFGIASTHHMAQGQSKRRALSP